MIKKLLSVLLLTSLLLKPVHAAGVFSFPSRSGATSATSNGGTLGSIVAGNALIDVDNGTGYYVRLTPVATLSSYTNDAAWSAEHNGGTMRSIQLSGDNGFTFNTSSLSGNGGALRGTVDSSLFGSGSVTSVAASIDNGLSVSGSPITTSGTLALSFNQGATLRPSQNLADLLSASTARTNLTLGNVENTALSTWAGTSNITTLGTIGTGEWSGTAITVSNGGTGAATAANARTNLGLGSVENTALSTWAGTTNITTLGTIQTGEWSGTNINIANGGTGSTSASGARTALGLVIGTDVFTQRTFTGDNGISLTNADGVSGAPRITIAINGDLVTIDDTQTLTNKTLTSPTLTTPSLGVATATSINSTTIPSSKTLVVTTDTLAVHASTTSAQLAGVLSDEVGTGRAVMNGSTTLASPTLITPAIGVATGTSLVTTGKLVAGTNVNGTTANFTKVLSSGVVNGTTANMTNAAIANGMYMTAWKNLGNGGTTEAIDFSKSNKIALVLNANCAISASADPAGATAFHLELLQHTVGSKTVTWTSCGSASGFCWPAGTAPTLTTTAAAIDFINCVYRPDKDRYYCQSGLDFR